MFDLFLGFVWALLVSMFAVPSIIYMAHTTKILDQPNERKIHHSLTPRLGGLAIFTGFMSALTIFGQLVDGIQQLLAGILIIFFVGVKDDIVTVSTFKKFFVQLLATGIVLFMADIRITSFQGLFGIGELDLGISYAFSFLVIIGVTNSINLIDGLDGLAGSIVLVISLVFGFYFLPVSVPYAFVAFSLAGGLIGFLRYNFYQAKIFMGDTGSLLCGFIVSVLAIQFIEKSLSPVAPAMSVGILCIPVFDTLRVFILRIISGHSPFRPDRTHIHHILLSLGFSSRWIVAILIVIMAMIISFTHFFSHLGNSQLVLIFLGLGSVTAILLEFAIRKFKWTEHEKSGS